MRYPAPASTTCSATLSAQLSITAHARRAAAQRFCAPAITEIQRWAAHPSPSPRCTGICAAPGSPCTSGASSPVGAPRPPRPRPWCAALRCPCLAQPQLNRGWSSSGTTNGGRRNSPLLSAPVSLFYHGVLDGGRATACDCGVIDEPGGRAPAPGESLCLVTTSYHSIYQSSLSKQSNE